MINENCLESLDAPVIRVGSVLTPIPFAKNLEEMYLPKERFEKELLKLAQY